MGHDSLIYKSQSQALQNGARLANLAFSTIIDMIQSIQHTPKHKLHPLMITAILDFINRLTKVCNDNQTSKIPQVNTHTHKMRAKSNSINNANKVVQFPF